MTAEKKKKKIFYIGGAER